MEKISGARKQRKEAAVKSGESIPREECNSLVMSMGRRLDEVIASKGYATEYELLFPFIYSNTHCSNTFAHLKIGWSDNKGVTFEVV